jgi:carbamate kinase
VLVIATDVDAAVLGWGTPDARPLGATTPAELRAHLAAGAFGSGSMGPKVDAACRFVDATGRRAVITSLHRLAGAVEGTAGTVVSPGEVPPEKGEPSCPTPSRSARSRS